MGRGRDKQGKKAGEGSRKRGQARSRRQVKRTRREEKRGARREDKRGRRHGGEEERERDEVASLANTVPRHSPSTSVGQLSILAESPLRKIWWRNSSVSEFRKMLFTSSWLQGGFFDDAAILKGRRKQDTRRFSCSTYSSSASTIRNTRLREGRAGAVSERERYR